MAGQTHGELPGQRRRFSRLGNLKTVDDTLPLDLGFLEIDEQTQSPSRSSQVVDTLRGVFVGRTLGAFQLNNQHIFHQNTGKVLTYDMALVSYWKRDFCSRSVKASKYPRASVFISGPLLLCVVLRQELSTIIIGR